MSGSYVDDSVGSLSHRSSSQEPSESKPAERVQPLAARETATVDRTKRLVHCVLFLAAIATASGTHLAIRQSEYDQFKSKFHTYSKEVLQGSERNVKDVFEELNSLSQSITSHGMTTSDVQDMKWPNVTLPQFGPRTSKVLESGEDTITFMFAPIVSAEEKKAWEDYAWKSQGWIKEDLELRESEMANSFLPPKFIQRRIHPFYPDDEYDVNEIETYVPIWQLGPTPTDTSDLLLDLYSHPSFRRSIDDAMEVHHMMLGEVIQNQFFETGSLSLPTDEPYTYGLQPVYDGYEDQSVVVAFVIFFIPWRTFFLNILSTETEKLLVEVEDSCGSPLSYEVSGNSAIYLGQGRLHDLNFDSISLKNGFAEFAEHNLESKYEVHCQYSLAVYPTEQLKSMYQTWDRYTFPLGLAIVFGFTALVFTFYNKKVQTRQDTVMDTAARTTAVVSSLFPSNIQERILADPMDHSENQPKAKDWSDFPVLSPRRKVKDFLAKDDNFPSRLIEKSRPIADLFPSASVIFADLVGFTAWSSVRDPSQVFQLLETLYNAFDELAKHRKVYKVETIGDCWVGSCGLPETRSDHAVRICRFASDIVRKTGVLVKQLEIELGPDTADLGIRVGIHSGPVTAGVLRGERARFQLFGDTVNTAARLESTGAKNRVHVSAETHVLLKAAGKRHWVTEREDKVVAKGKGELRTFWLSIDSDHTQTSASSGDVDDIDEELVELDSAQSRPRQKLSKKNKRLIRWNADLLFSILKDNLKNRHARRLEADAESKIRAAEEAIANRQTLVIDELQDIIDMPDWKSTKATKHADTGLDPQVLPQLIDFITDLCHQYRENPFHNFEHASHVTMSVIKLLNRIVQADDVADASEAALHDQTYGLTSDPLTQFAAVLSALIHDVDHSGVPNATLIVENASVATHYKGKSPAEQHSVDCAWEILQKECYHELRRAIYTTTAELQRFRQLIVCCVLSTDIADKQLSQARKFRWKKAFSTELTCNESTTLVRNRKATIVLEHLIQASDVSHTMQHWHVYRRWNENFFHECMEAYHAGRAATNPANGWYEGELGFFDFYIIPLAQNLAECGVFGVSSSEYLNYATSNREEWENRGRKIVEEMVENYQHRKKKNRTKAIH